MNFGGDSMKKAVMFLCAFAVIFSSAFIISVSGTGSSRYNIAKISRYEDDMHRFFCQGNDCFFVSASKSQIIINKVHSNGECTVKYFTAESDVLSCEFVSGKLYFHCKDSN